MKNIKAGQEIKCPHCKGKGGKTELLYYWIKCYLCLGVGKMTINKIIEKDAKHGDIKCEFTVYKNYDRAITQKAWLI